MADLSVAVDTCNSSSDKSFGCVSSDIYLVQLSMVAAERPALQLPPRRAPQDGFKKGAISRAEGGQLQAPVGPLRARRQFGNYSFGYHGKLLSSTVPARQLLIWLPRQTIEFNRARWKGITMTGIHHHM